jgi:hypothetical protein
VKYWLRILKMSKEELVCSEWQEKRIKIREVGKEID